MPSREIDRAEWASFCNDFTLEHQGDTVTVEILDDFTGKQIAAHNEPFFGIAPAGQGARSQLEIIIGEDDETGRRLTIRQPLYMELIEEDDGADAELHIETESATAIAVRLLSVALPMDRDDLVLADQTDTEAGDSYNGNTLIPTGGRIIDLERAIGGDDDLEQGSPQATGGDVGDKLGMHIHRLREEDMEEEETGEEEDERSGD